MPFHWALNVGDIEDCEDLGQGILPAYHGTISTGGIIIDRFRPQLPPVGEQLEPLWHIRGTWFTPDIELAQLYAGIDEGDGIPGQSQIYDCLLYYDRGIRIERMWTPDGEEADRLRRCLDLRPDLLMMERYADAPAMEVLMLRPSRIEIVAVDVYTADGEMIRQVEQGDGSLRGAAWRRHAEELRAGRSARRLR